MKSFRLMRCISLLLCLALLLPTALGEGVPLEDVAESLVAVEPIPSETSASVQLEEHSLDLMGHSLRWPQVTGMADEALQETVNQQLTEALHLKELTERVTLLLSSERKLTADWTATVAGDILSCVLTVSGPVKDTRMTEVTYTCVLDLRSGTLLTLDNCFTDGSAAREALADYLESVVLPELSPHLQAAELLPIPETFTVSREALTLHYPVEQLETFAGHPGTVVLRWYEWADLLSREEDSLPARLDVWELIDMGEDSADRIREMAESGSLPGLPAHLGDQLTGTDAAEGLAADPDLYEGGRYVQPDSGRWRDAWLMTAFNPDKGDRVTELEGYTVFGIRADRIALWGIVTGKTTMEEWRAILGEPQHTVHLDLMQADLLRLPEGSSDYYLYGDTRLRLHADSEGVLQSVILTR